jgi:hypothetical protein
MKYLLVFCVGFLFIAPTPIQAVSRFCEKDTTKKRRIEYDYVRSGGNESETSYTSDAFYYFEGDSLDTPLTYNNLWRDLKGVKKMKRYLRKAKHAYFWEGVRNGLIGASLFLLFIPLIILLFKPLVWWIWALIGIVLTGLSVPIWFFVSFLGTRNYTPKLMKVIDKYNKMVDKQAAKTK